MSRLLRPLPVLLVLCCVLGTAPLVAEEELPDLRVREHPKLVLPDGAEVPGKLVEVDGTTVVFIPAGDERPTRYQRDQYRELLRPISAEEVVAQRGRILLARDGDHSLEVLRTLRWGVEQGATESVISLAVAAVERYPDDQRLAELAISLVRPGTDAEVSRDQLQSLEQIARRGLESNPRWEDGYRVLTFVLEQQGRRGEYDEVLDAWLEHHPTSLEANLLVAQRARAAGDTAAAREAYRKAYTFRDHLESGVDYAVMSLSAGDVGEAERVAAQLIEAGVAEQQNRLILGIAHVHAGRDQQAIADLEDGLRASDELSGELKALAVYHLGLARYRIGDRGEAVALWRQIDGPGARLALAIAEGRRVGASRVRGLEDDQREVLAIHNASVALHRRDHEAALESLVGLVGERPLFLRHVAEMLAAGASQEAVATLEAHDGVESLRWQLYGHVLAQRYDEALAVAMELPQDDAYARLCRVFIAEARGQRELARSLFQDLGVVQASVLPEYQAKLADLFDAADDQLRAYDFDWPEGFELAHGWQARGRGTGIQVRIADAHLVLSGRQSAAPDPVTRAWCLVSPERLYEASAELDFREMGQAVGGIELLDEAQRNGIAYAVDGEGVLSWRQLEDGRWGDWVSLEQRVDGSRVTLRIRYEHRFLRVSARIDERSVALGKDPALTSDYLCFAIFGAASPGTGWTLRADRVRIQVEAPDASDRGGRPRRGGR